jgi:hypothetical protein
MVRLTVKTAPQLLISLGVAVGLGIGCSKLAPKPANPEGVNTPSDSASIEQYATNWTRYTSPDGRVSIEYPATCAPRMRSKGGESDPDVAFLLDDPAQLLDVSFVYVSAEKGLPKGFISKQMDAAQGEAKALTSRQVIEIGGAMGLRQDFTESGASGSTVFINLGLESNGGSVHVTVGCDAELKDKLWPVCERIVHSIRFTNSKR